MTDSHIENLRLYGEVEALRILRDRIACLPDDLRDIPNGRQDILERAGRP